MIKSGDQIRLTKPEQELFAHASQGAAAPKTIEEHNQALEAAAQDWEQGSSSDEQLAALLARDLKISE